MTKRLMTVLTSLSVLAIYVPTRGGDDSRQAQLKAIESAQAVASQRYSNELQQVDPTGKAQKAAVDRYLKEL